MCKPFSLVPRSMLSVRVNVKYQGYNFRKNGRCGGIRVSQTHLVGLELNSNIIKLTSKEFLCRLKLKYIYTCIRSVFGMVENIVETGENAGYQRFLLFT